MKRWCAALLLLLMGLTGVSAESSLRALYHAGDGCVRVQGLPDGPVAADIELHAGGAVFCLSGEGAAQGGMFDLALFDTVLTLREASGAAPRGELLRAFEKGFALLTAYEITEKDGGSALAAPCAALLSPRIVLEKDSSLMLRAGGESYSFSLKDITTSDPYAPPAAENGNLGVVRVHTACNLREGPSAATAKLGGAGERDEYPLLEQKESWYRVRLHDGREAWLSCNMAHLLPPPGREDAMRLMHAGEWTGAARAYEALGMADAARACRLLIRLKDAEKLLRREEYAQARAAFEDLGGFGGADRQARALEGVEKMPDSGILYAASLSLPHLLKVECPLHARPFFLVFTGEGVSEPALKLFIRPGDMLTAPLAPGDYTVDYTMGSVWYGEEKGFGPSARRARARISLPENTALCTLCLSPREGGNTPFEEKGN